MKRAENKHLLSKILSYSASSFIAMAMVAIYTLTDQIFIGQKMREVGLSALGLAAPITMLLSSVGAVFKIGGGEKYLALYENKYIQIKNSFYRSNKR